MRQRDKEKQYNQIAESDFHVRFLRLAEWLILSLFMIILKWVRKPIMTPVMFKWISSLSIKDELGCHVEEQLPNRDL